MEPSPPQYKKSTPLPHLLNNQLTLETEPLVVPRDPASIVDVLPHTCRNIINTIIICLSISDKIKQTIYFLKATQKDE